MRVGREESGRGGRDYRDTGIYGERAVGGTSVTETGNRRWRSNSLYLDSDSFCCVPFIFTLGNHGGYYLTILLVLL